ATENPHEERAMKNQECKLRRNHFFLNVCVFITSFFIMAVSAMAQNLSAGRPANVPPDFMVTPFGYMHPSCVVHVHEGERAGKDMLLHHADGTAESIPVCQYPRYTKKGEVAEVAASVKSAARAQPPQPTISW